jgi:tetratricopeptide (TPR) repeat protein
MLSRLITQTIHGFFAKKPSANWRGTLSEDNVPRDVLAQLERGKMSLAANDYPGAEKLFSGILDSYPDNLDANFLLARIKAYCGEWHTALTLLNKVIHLKPNHVSAHCDLGNVYFLNGQLEQALSAYNNALFVDQNCALALYNKGNVLKAQHKVDEAISCYSAALEREPYFGEALAGWAGLLVDQKKIDVAKNFLEIIVSANPDFPDAWAALGFVMQKADKFDDAVRYYRRALELKPDASDTLNNLGTVLQSLDQIDEAEECYRNALRVNPNHALALNHLGTIMKMRGNLDEALQFFTAAININRDLTIARWHRSTIWLMQGNFHRGWDEYEYRTTAMDFPVRQSRITRWTGSALKQKRILVYAEQGLGDEIMFASCFQDLVNQAGHVVIDCAKKLESIFTRSFPSATVCGANQTNSIDDFGARTGVDLAIPAGSLPMYFRRNSCDFPIHNGYLQADTCRRDHWASRLATLGTGLKVGLSWRGGTKKTSAKHRSLELQQLMPILSTPGTCFISLQHDGSSHVIDMFGQENNIKIHHWEEALTNYDETAALISSMDLIVSVCTSVVHLGGALGKPTWVLVPFSPEWRYMAHGETMPWYPSVKIFRQPNLGEWVPVIDRVARELLKYQREPAYQNNCTLKEIER